MAKDKEGRNYFFGQSGTTRLSRYTRLEVPGGPSVRVLHDGKLSKEQRDTIRANVGKARENVNTAIENLSHGLNNLGPESRQQLAKLYNVQPEQLNEAHIQKISNDLKRTASGLSSKKIEIKLNDKMYAGEIGRVYSEETGRYQNTGAQYREIAGRGKAGSAIDASAKVNMTMTTSFITNSRDGAQHIAGVVSQTAAGLDYRDGATIGRFSDTLKTAYEQDQQRKLDAVQARAPEPLNRNLTGSTLAESLQDQPHADYASTRERSTATPVTAKSHFSTDSSIPSTNSVGSISSIGSASLKVARQQTIVTGRARLRDIKGPAAARQPQGAGLQGTAQDMAHAAKSRPTALDAHSGNQAKLISDALHGEVAQSIHQNNYAKLSDAVSSAENAVKQLKLPEHEKKTLDSEIQKIHAAAQDINAYVSETLEQGGSSFPESAMKRYEGMHANLDAATFQADMHIDKLAIPQKEKDAMAEKFSKIDSALNGIYEHVKDPHAQTRDASSIEENRAATLAILNTNMNRQSADSPRGQSAAQTAGLKPRQRSRSSIGR